MGEYKQSFKSMISSVILELNADSKTMFTINIEFFQLYSSLSKENKASPPNNRGAYH